MPDSTANYCPVSTFQARRRVRHNNFLVDLISVAGELTYKSAVPDAALSKSIMVKTSTKKIERKKMVRNDVVWSEFAHSWPAEFDRLAFDPGRPLSHIEHWYTLWCHATVLTYKEKWRYNDYGAWDCAASSSSTTWNTAGTHGQNAELTIKWFNL